MSRPAALIRATHNRAAGTARAASAPGSRAPGPGAALLAALATVAGLAGGLAAAPAQAATQTFQTSLSLAAGTGLVQAQTTATDAAQPVLPAFDSTLGTLTGVDLHYSFSWLTHLDGSARGAALFDPLVGPSNANVLGQFGANTVFKLELVEDATTLAVYSDADARGFTCFGTSIFEPSCGNSDQAIGNPTNTLAMPAVRLGLFIAQPGDSTVGFSASSITVVQVGCRGSTTVTDCSAGGTSQLSGTLSITYTYASAVPEPGAWALLLAGLGALGWASGQGRRHRRSHGRRLPAGAACTQAGHPRGRGQGR